MDGEDEEYWETCGVNEILRNREVTNFKKSKAMPEMAYGYGERKDGLQFSYFIPFISLTLFLPSFPCSQDNVQ